MQFNSENEFELDEIKLVNPLAIDQYGVRVGDTYRQVLQNAKPTLRIPQTITNTHTCIPQIQTFTMNCWGILSSQKRC